ncbi:MAG: PEP-CTERM sorting domain-containing protein [Planctomycetaceae bacterium]|jgi:hypothetical protein|nr:PEP-CTERM sorting domain-containing protein [Planctomycetaceae bacterium]
MKTQHSIIRFGENKFWGNQGRAGTGVLNVFLFAALLGLAAFPSSVQAQPDGYSDHYKQTNSSFDTFEIGWWKDGSKLVEVFSTYFAKELGILGESYSEGNNGNDLFAARGIHQFVDSWHVNAGAEMFGKFRTAAMWHDVNLTNFNGDTVWSQRYQGGSNFFDKEFDENPRYTIGVEGDYNVSLGRGVTWTDNNGEHSETFDTFYGNQLGHGLIRMIAFDVTDLLRLKYGDMDIKSAYMFAWEDSSTDFDYNDMIYIMTNVTPNGVTYATPEPATMLIFGLGIAGAVAARRRRR